ncbi:hypothetical protein KKF05_03600 [Patescibacteria group bacterium]|nr:hypothetical protein [Patescibacteria group bacterium]MBU1916380.1 hypothetical protein [Patescibacteria group bacterium]
MNKDDNFGYDNPPDWLPDFSLDLVAELDALVRAFGVDDPKISVRRIKFDGPLEIYVSVALTKHRAVLISDQPGCADVHRSYIRRFDGGMSYVIWQQGVTVEGVRQLINKLRSISTMFGAADIDQVLGERQPGDNEAKGDYSVDRHFRVFGQLTIPLFSTTSLEQLVAMFDRPEEVAIIETLRGRGLCRKSDLPYMLARERLVKLLLAEYNIIPDQVDQLAPGELDKVYAAVEGELKKIFDPQNQS